MRRFGVGAHHARLTSSAEDQADGVNDDRFARARLAGEDVESAREAESQLINDRKILDGEFSQHGLSDTDSSQPIV